MALEDYTTYDEIDPDGDFTVATNTITVDTMIRDLIAHITDDKGVNHFGDFEHLEDGKITLAELRTLCISHGLSNGHFTYRDMQNNNDGIVIIFYRLSTGAYQIRVVDWETDNSDLYVCALNTDYWLKIERVKATTTFTVKIYSDEYITLETTLSIICNVTDYQYIIACGSMEDSNILYKNNEISCIIRNLDLQEAPPPSGGSMQPMKHWGAI